jgi:hypothetical protein
MPRRNAITEIMAASALALFCGISVLPKAFSQQQANNTAQTLVMADCSPDLKQANERIFANIGLKSWKEYAKPAEVPPLNRDNGEEMFVVRVSPSGEKYVRSIEYTEDSSMYYEYCFGNAGWPRRVRYEMRTAWGWWYEDDQFYLTPRMAMRHTKYFFDTASNKMIPRPRQADDVPDFLKPKIYWSFNTLPFISIFNEPRTDAP